MPSLYVGVSRVHDIDKLRVLPFWKEDVEYLTSLKRDPLLKLWFENYTEDGIWKGDGLQSFAAGVRKNELQRLALVDDLIFFTAEELKLYAKNLDVYVGSANKPEVIKILKPFYAEGRKLLSANGNRLLRLLRSELLLKLRQQGALGKLRITDLKSYAKRLGFDMSQRTSRKNLERSLEKLMVDGVAGINLAPPSDIGGIVVDSDSKLDVTQSEIKTLSGNVQSLTIKSMLDGDDNKSSTKSVLYEANNVDIVAQICNIFKTYNLHITGIMTLPDGNRYDRIFNVGGGDCFFHSICQGLEFFGISIDHVDLRTKVGRWLQNADNANLMETHLEIQPSGLYHHLKRFPAPPTGWMNYLNGMTWQDWGVHVELLGEWVGPMEITPTNHVLEEMGSDIRVNIYDPRSRQVFGDEENQDSDGTDKPIIMIMSLTGHYEWLRLRDD